MDGAGRLASGSGNKRVEEPIIAGFVRVGRISGPHGLGGALRVRPDNPESDSLAQVGRVFLRFGSAIEERRLRSVQRLNRATLKIALDGIDDANAAEVFKGAFVLVAEGDLPPAAPGQFYYYQVLGCEVVTTAGDRLGVVAEVFSTGANDVWVVRDGDREVLAPVIEDVVQSLDLAARRIVIKAIPGLLD
jgi:16S rRNA processing protein RimM